VNKKARLIVLSAPSGSGKTTILKDVLSNYPEFVFSISATTRKKRNVEVDGKDYFFLSEDEFKKKIEQNEFIEWEIFYDYYYGTLKDQIDMNIRKGLTTLFEVDVKGALSIKKYYPDSILIFVTPPSIEELKKRLVQRKTETEEDLRKRIERAEMELSYKDKFDYVISNIDLENAKLEVKKIIDDKIKEE
jgi:guanylate kinase